MKRPRSDRDAVGATMMFKPGSESRFRSINATVTGYLAELANLSKASSNVVNNNPCTKEQTAMRNSSTRQAHHSDTNGCLCRRRCTVVHVARQPCPRPISEPSYIHAHGRPPPPRRPGVALIDIQAAMAHRGASGCTLAGIARHWSARTRRARRVRSPQHARPAPPTTCDPTTRHDGTRSPGRVTRQPAPRGPAPGRPCSRSHRTRTGQMPLEGSGQARDSVASTLHCKMDKRTHSGLASDRVLY